MAKKNIDEAAKIIIDAIKNSPEVMQTIDSAIKEARDEALETQKEIDQTLSSIGTSRESLIKRTSHLKGKRQYYRLSEIYAALIHYKDEAPDRKKVTEYALAKYRKGMAEDGYKSIQKEKQLIPIVEAFGNVKDKVALILACYWDKEKVEREAPIITKGRVDAIRQQLAQQGSKEDRCKFAEYIAIYQSLTAVYNNFFRIRYYYLYGAYDTSAFMHAYKYEKIRSIISSFAMDEQVKHNLLSEISSFLGESKDVKVTAIEKSAENILSQIRISKPFLHRAFAEYKGACLALDKWIEDREAEMLVPMIIREEKEDRFGDVTGGTLSAKDKDFVNFPSWETVEESSFMRDSVYSQLDAEYEKALAER